MLLQMTSSGAMGGGVSSAVARAVGAGDRDAARKLVVHAIVIALCAGLAYSLLLLGLGRALYVLLGFILEGTAVMLLTVPILLPVVIAAGIDPIWFGIFVIVVSGAGLIHPPLGLLLFVVKSMLPDVPMKQVVWGVLPYLGTELVLVALLIAFPGIVMVLPRLMP